MMAFLRKRIKHVIYVVKENRTYDQIHGDLPRGNGDPSLAILSPYSPNHQALASQFVILDNFHDSGETSNTGWNWTTAARATDFTEKTSPVNYAGRGLTYDWEGGNRNINVSLPTVAERQAVNPAIVGDPDLLPGTADVAAPDSTKGEAGTGYLWDAALRKGLTIRNYGFLRHQPGQLERHDPRGAGQPVRRRGEAGGGGQAGAGPAHRQSTSAATTRTTPTTTCSRSGSGSSISTPPAASCPTCRWCACPTTTSATSARPSSG